jgi:hypothetical protein
MRAITGIAEFIIRRRKIIIILTILIIIVSAFFINDLKTNSGLMFYLDPGFLRSGHRATCKYSQQILHRKWIFKKKLDKMTNYVLK